MKEMSGGTIITFLIFLFQTLSKEAEIHIFFFKQCVPNFTYIWREKIWFIYKVENSTHQKGSFKEMV